MVVILIMGGVLALGGTRLFNPNENRRSQIRKIAIQTKNCAPLPVFSMRRFGSSSISTTRRDIAIGSRALAARLFSFQKLRKKSSRN
jgi:hypothetical protein